MKRQNPKRDNTKYNKLYGKDSDDSGDETELFVRKPTYQETPTLLKDVEEGDTLQSLSIRYHCSISELKRLNHIHNDNEIFAKRTIKVPDRPFTAILAGVHNSGRSSPNDVKKEVDIDALESKLKRNLLGLPACSNGEAAANFNEVIFNSHIASKPCDNVCDEEIECEDDEEINLLPKETVVEPVVVSKFSCSGADADISWIALIVCVVILSFALPLIYVLYIYEHPKHPQHPDH